MPALKKKKKEEKKFLSELIKCTRWLENWRVASRRLAAKLHLKELWCVKVPQKGCKKNPERPHFLEK